MEAIWSVPKLNYERYKGVLSHYKPSCLMMDYFIHIMNDALVGNSNFERYCPNYHPYYIRLYYGVLFWIQCLRARDHARCLSFAESYFLRQFLTDYPPESLPVCGPLLYICKSLCTSQPERNYGLVVPEIPKLPGPDRRDEFMRESLDGLFLPNVPGILALIKNLHETINRNANAKVYPSRGGHIPVTADAANPTIFGTCSFPVLALRSDFQRYSLCSPGLQYPCEADEGLNQSFDECYESFSIPVMDEDDTLHDYPTYLHMDRSMYWFEQVKLVATKAAKFFVESGTLSDCPPHGLPINQYVCNLQAPSILPAVPEHSADPRSLIEFRLKLSTTVRKPIFPIEALAASSQTHMKMYPTHPYLGAFGEPVGTGPFWDIRPLATSAVDSSSYLSYHSVIRDMMKDSIS